MIIVPSDVLPVVAAFDPGEDERAQSSARQVIELLRGSPAPFSRTTFDPGHITASAVVLSPDGLAVLLAFHDRLERWLQPGGHIEPRDRSVADAARREVLEETGIRVSTSGTDLVSLDVHEIPPTRREPQHRHHDLMFRFRLDAPTDPAPDASAVWCPIGELERYGIDSPLRRGIARALA